jgi:hypothetical protein
MTRIILKLYKTLPPEYHFLYINNNLKNSLKIAIIIFIFVIFLISYLVSALKVEFGTRNLELGIAARISSFARNVKKRISKID